MAASGCSFDNESIFANLIVGSPQLMAVSKVDRGDPHVIQRQVTDRLRGPTSMRPSDMNIMFTGEEGDFSDSRTAKR